MKDERKLVLLNRAADGQFSCDTGLSRPASPIRRGRVGIHRLLGDGSYAVRSIS